ncbi:hypothetical protein ACRAWB_03700 [Leifsonia poae]|uniref:hypothetical protein n=1 Tax=Leifsonia poae TaxID=110933 RepID=UPI003D69E197
MNRLAKVTATSGIALSLVLGSGVVAANADEAPGSAEAVFDEFVDALGVSATTDAALTQRFDRLSDAEQERLVDAIEEDPLSVLTITAGEPTLTSGTATTAEPAVARNSAPTAKRVSRSALASAKTAAVRVAGGLHVQTVASNPRYTATYPVNASLFGITTGTFTMRYVFEATSTAVSRNLECTGWFTGAAGVWSISTSQSNYVSGGLGSCTVNYRMSFAFKGSFFSANKQQQLQYKGTRLASASLKNI